MYICTNDVCVRVPAGHGTPAGRSDSSVKLENLGHQDCTVRTCLGLSLPSAGTKACATTPGLPCLF